MRNKFLPAAVAAIALLFSVFRAPTLHGQSTTAPSPAPTSTQSSTPSNESRDLNSAPQTSAPTDNLSREANPGDPLLDVPPLPKGKVTMEGGTVAKIDPIRNRLLLQPFGGKEKMKLWFDERSHIYRDGRETTQAAIRQGDRIYVDTMLDGPHVFARNIRIVSERISADVTGQVVAFNAGGNMTVRDRLSSSDLTFKLAPATRVNNLQGQTMGLSDVAPGAIVSVHLLPGERTGVDQIKVLARPGEIFTFSGRITNIDLRNGMMAVNNQSDNEIYDIAFDSGDGASLERLRMGNDVVVKAIFTGKGYRADSISPGTVSVTPE